MNKYKVRNIAELNVFIGIIVGGIAATVVFACVTHGIPEKIAQIILNGGKF